MNIIGVAALTKKELHRFVRVPFQTLGSPIVTTFLYFVVFATAVGTRVGAIGGLSYSEFIMPGLIMMNVLTTSFVGVSSGLMLSKLMNSLTDLLVSPMSYAEIVAGYTTASVVRSVILGALMYITALLFVPYRIDYPVYLVVATVLVAATFSLFGMIVGIWASNFEQLTAIPTFLITPLTFLGGIFYSIDMLPPVAKSLSQYNPFLYMINGMRYGFYGVSDVPAAAILLVLVVMCAVLVVVTWWLLKIGYKLKS